jgi:hypothetical protein
MFAARYNFNADKADEYLQAVQIKLWSDLVITEKFMTLGRQALIPMYLISALQEIFSLLAKWLYLKFASTYVLHQCFHSLSEKKNFTWLRLIVTYL